MGRNTQSNNNVENSNSTPAISKDEVQRRAERDKLGALIMFSIDIESNFKLYSYRVITPEVFQERILELITHLNEIK